MRIVDLTVLARRCQRSVSAAAAVVILGVGGTDRLEAQTVESFTEAVESVRIAWLTHDFSGIVSSSDTVRLQLPGIGRSPQVRPSQAAMVLKEYLKSANEIEFVLRNPRSVSDDHVYAQMTRRYVVQGTSDERVETVFLGFRRLDGKWYLREVRIAP